MITVLEFIFRSFWTWAGTLVLVAVIVGGLASWRPVTIIRHDGVDEKDG